MKTQHTQLPWKAIRAIKPDNTGGFDYSIVDTTNRILGEVFEHVGFSKYDGYDKRPACVNAEFILEACNNYEALHQSHAELLAVLKEIISDEPGWWCPTCRKSLVGAIAAPDWRLTACAEVSAAEKLIAALEASQ